MYVYLVEEWINYKVSKMYFYYIGEKDSNLYVMFEKDIFVIN